MIPPIMGPIIGTIKPYLKSDPPLFGIGKNSELT